MADIVLVDEGWAGAVNLLFLVVIVLLVIGALAAHRPVLFRMGLRNAARRPSQTSLVVIGLMIGTAILSGAMVSGDTMEFAIVKGNYEATDLLDETVGISGGQTFNYSVYEAFASDAAVDKASDALSPVMSVSGVTAFDTISRLTEPNVVIHGIDPILDRPFGRFETGGGRKLDGSDLGDNETIINKRLANALEARIGHVIDIYFVSPIPAAAGGGGGGGGGAPVIDVDHLTVKYIVVSEGKANLNGGHMMFTSLDTAQVLFNASGRINMVKVSNPGGIVDGADGTPRAKKALESVIARLGPEAGAPPSMFAVSTIKKDVVDIAESSSASFSDFLLMASSFTVAAGVMLIINIFVMLAEERKRELGISRAVGMRRSFLVRAFMFEGTLYSVVASALGALLGIVVAWALIAGIFSAVGASALDVPFYFKNSSILMAFGLGFLITIGTVTMASYRASKLNIVRAVRSIEEPVTEKGTRKGVIGGAVLMAIGVLFIMGGFGPGGSGMARLLGPVAFLFGLALVIRKWTRAEVAYTFGGLTVLFYSLYFLLYDYVSEDLGMIALVIEGLLMVFSAVLALVSNSRALVRGLGRLVSFSPRAKAVAEPAIGYSMNKGFRTGMTISMFALIIFIVLLFSIFFSVFTPNLEEEGGGYHLYANTSVPVMDINNISFGGMPGSVPVDYTTLRTKVDIIDPIVQHSFWGNFFLDDTEVPTYGPPFHSLFGIDAGFASHVKYSLKDRDKAYATDRDAWMAIVGDPNMAIVDSQTAGTYVPITVGDEVSLPSMAGSTNASRKYKVIGIVEELILSGMFVQKEGMFEDFPQVRGNNLFLIKVKAGEGERKVAKDLEADLAIIGMNVIVLQDVLEQATEAMASIFQMFELFMSLGLVVGIASLGVLSVRSVIERKQEIGIMRAIGYTRRMVLGTFVYEMLFITTMGILIGVAIGWTAGYGIWKSGMEALGVEFSVPWVRIGTIILVTYIAAVVCTVLPAYKASRTNPAEAVRWVG